MGLAFPLFLYFVNFKTETVLYCLWVGPALGSLFVKEEAVAGCLHPPCIAFP